MSDNPPPSSPAKPTKRLVLIVIPDGYTDAAEFAKDCGFELPTEVNTEGMQNYAAGRWSRRNLEAMLEDFSNV